MYPFLSPSGIDKIQNKYIAHPRLWLLIGNSSDIEEAAECASLSVESGAQVSAICHGAGDYVFVEARARGGRGYMEDGVAVLMLPEVRVLSRD